MTKTCRICKLVKDLRLFPKNATANDGRYHTCKSCHQPGQNAKRKEHRKDVSDFYKMFLCFLLSLGLLTSCRSQKKAQRLPYCMTGHGLKNLVDSNGFWNFYKNDSTHSYQWNDTLRERIWVKTNTFIFDGGFRIDATRVEPLDSVIYSTWLSDKNSKHYDRIWVHSSKIDEHTFFVLEENFAGSLIVDTVTEIKNVMVFSNSNGNFNINLHDKH